MVLASLLLFLLPAAGAPVVSVVGELVAVPAPGEAQLRVRGDSGAEVVVAFDDTTAFLRARPGATTLAGAETVRAADLAKGDRVLCQGAAAEGGAPMRARRIVVMSRSDVDAAQQKQREDWRRRGSSGVVAAVDAAKREFTLRLRTAPGATAPASLVVDASSPSVVFRRYAPGSLRFADARAGTFEDLAVGDQVRVLGAKSPDGARIVAEQLVSGSFRVVRGVLKQSTDGVLSVQEEGKGAGMVAVTLAEGALVRRLPPFVVTRLLRAASGETGDAPAGAWPGGGTAGAPGAGPGGASRSGGPGSAGAPGPPGGFGGAGGPGGRSMNPDEMLERLPAVAITDLKPGEEIAALGSRGPEASRLSALKLVAWTVPETAAAGARGNGRGGMGGGQQGDPFADLLGAGGETSW